MSAIMIALVWALSCSGSVAEEASTASTEEIRLAPDLEGDPESHVVYRIEIRGKIITPTDNGPQEWDLASDGVFAFDQRQHRNTLIGPPSIRAVRVFSEAGTVTTVGRDFRTSSMLPASHRRIHVYGEDSQLVNLSPSVRLTRAHVDLLQLPFDPLICRELLPGRTLSSETEEWNTESWVLPMLVGLEAAATQKLTCQVERMSETLAIIRFTGSADGAVNGSASQIQVKGQLNLDRTSGRIVEGSARLEEKRSLGSVSPGLDVKASVSWKQTAIADGVDVTGDPADSGPDPDQLLLTLVTPWRLLLLHDRRWHVITNTSEELMLRMLHQGALVGQCNISREESAKAGSFTGEADFLSRVSRSVADVKGTIKGSSVTDFQDGWRRHSVLTEQPAAEKTIHRNYHLCTSESGDQFVLVFMHEKSDAATFADQEQQFLKSLTLRPVRQAVPLPR
ncbi:MAG: hypothetical protein KDA96_16905 [Planctomycetaceae bacterium]|nr:hypothetical protein [Planctomycetaceae bacterium]